MFAGFLSSGLFLGWSLGANDASNVFGTAVGTKMIRFRTAAIYCSIFVILGAVISGAGASHTLGKLGSVNAVAGAFIVAFASAFSVYLMTLARFPVSTSQAIVGAIIGWNLFSGSLTDMNSLVKIVSTWVFCPLLSACFAIFLYLVSTFVIRRLRIHMFTLDSLTRHSLLFAGIFGSYALGANNIANVMGVFVPIAPFGNISFIGITLSPAQQLFFLGGVAIAVGVFTYSRRVMLTVGSGIFRLSPVAAAVVVWSHSAVLFLFSSQSLETWLQSHHLPSIPLVPVSSSQAIVGAVIGIGLLKGGRSIHWKTVGGITSSWVTTPVLSALICFISLFFLQNVFQQKTFIPVEYNVTSDAIQRIAQAEISPEELKTLLWQEYPNGVEFSRAVNHIADLKKEELKTVLTSAEIFEVEISDDILDNLEPDHYSTSQLEALWSLEGRTFQHKWQIEEALSEHSEDFMFKPGNKQWNTNLNTLYRNLFNHLQN